MRLVRVAAATVAAVWATQAGYARSHDARAAVAPPYRDATLVVLPPIPDARIGEHISASLPRAERAVMQSVMLQLPPAERYNVLYFDARGGIHASAEGLGRIARSYMPPSRGPQSDVAAKTPARAYSCSSPPASTNSGAFRAVYSTCDTPYAFSEVYLPCRASGDIFLNYPRNEAAFIYEGGFSGRGDAVDAGLQYSWAYDDWALFVNGAHGPASLNPAFACNQTVPLKFYPASDTLLALNVTGYTAYGQFANYTATYAVARNKGWSPTCARCIVKRVTSLAQTGAGFPNGSDGSYLGLDASFGPAVRWSNSSVGFWNGRTPVGYNVRAWTGNVTGGYRSYPSDSNRVRVRFDDAADETVGLILQ